jgi:hypothetical protein
MALLIGVFMSSCTPHIPVYKEPVKNEVDVVVIIFDINKDVKDYSEAANFQKKIALNVAALLQKKGITALVVNSEKDTQDIKAKYVISGTILDVDPGSSALRTWSWMGRALIEAKATLIEKSTNAIVEEFNNYRSSGSMLGKDKILQKVCIELSKDIVHDFIEKIKIEGKSR